MPTGPGPRDESQELSPSAVDHIASLAKGAIGFVPGVGPLLAELVGTVIPNQRIDRLAKFAAAFGARVVAQDETMLRVKLQDENFTDLIEEGLRAAARAVTDERRAYIAALIANGIDADRLAFVESRHLLRLLGEINDVEILWLHWYGLAGYPVRQAAFQDAHADSLGPLMIIGSSKQPEIDKQTLRDSYRHHLRSLGLIDVKSPLDLPPYEYVIARTGGLLLRQIDAFDGL